MKKILGLLLAVVFFVPFTVNAATTPNDPVCTGDLTSTLGATRTCQWSVTSTDSLTAIAVQAWADSGAQIISVTRGAEWLGNDLAEAGTMNLIHSGSGTTPGQVLVVTTVSRVTSSNPNDPCNTHVTFTINNETTSKTTSTTTTANPKTGATLPYFIVGGCAILAVGIYVVASKKTKLHKI